MAWDLNLRLANNLDVSADVDGSWVHVNDVPTGAFTPQSGTMLIADWARSGLVEFRLWIRGTALGGDVDPTRVDLVADIEEADDDSGTNARPVCRFRMGSGTADASPSGYAYTKTADATEDAQFAAVGVVVKEYIRVTFDVTLTGGTNPTVEFTDVTVYARGLGMELETIPAAVNQ